AAVVGGVACPVEDLASEVLSGVAAADGQAVEVACGFGAFIGGPQSRVGVGVEGDACDRLRVVPDDPGLSGADAGGDPLAHGCGVGPGLAPLVNAPGGEPG